MPPRKSKQTSTTEASCTNDTFQLEKTQEEWVAVTKEITALTEKLGPLKARQDDLVHILWKQMKTVDTSESTSFLEKPILTKTTTTTLDPDEDSDDNDVEPVKVTTKKAPAKKAPAKKQVETPDGGEPVVEKKPVAKKAPVKKAVETNDEDDEEESVVEKKPTGKKVVEKKIAEKKVVEKKVVEKKPVEKKVVETKATKSEVLPKGKAVINPSLTKLKQKLDEDSEDNEKVALHTLNSSSSDTDLESLSSCSSESECSGGDDD